MNKVKTAFNLSGGKWDKTHEQSRRVYDTSGLCPTLHTCGGGNQEVKIMVKQGGIMVGQSPSFQHGSLDGISRTITQQANNGTTNGKTARKLTSLECWRLMDFDDEDFYKAQKALNETFYKGKNKSSSQLYKQAGNSIVVACITRNLEGLK